MHAGRHQPGLKQQPQQQEQRTPCPLSLLPIDLLGEMFPTPNVEGARKDPNRLSVRLASRWLRDAFDSCNTHLTLVGAARAESKGSAQRRSYHALLQCLIARTSSLSSLHIKDWDNNRELLKLPVPWVQLKELDLSGSEYCDLHASGKPKKLQAFGPLSQCSALEELTIFSGCLFMSKPDSLPFCPALQSLHLILPSNSDLGRIAPLFTALQRLTINTWDPDRFRPDPEDKWCRQCDLANIASCTGLRQLSLWLNAFDNINGNMSSLSSLTQLTQLQLIECEDLEDLQSIALLSSLRHLELEVAYKITDLSPLGSLRSTLERLIMTRCPSRGSACLSSCTSLRHIDIECCEDDYVSSFELSALSACVLLGILT